MEQFIFEVIKSLLSVAGGTLAGWFQTRKVTKKLSMLEKENSQRQQNIDSMQSTLIVQQGQLISYQDELIKTKDALEDLKMQVRVFEQKSEQDEIIKQSLRGRVAELEEVCERQEREIEKLKAELAETLTRVTILEN